LPRQTPPGSWEIPTRPALSALRLHEHLERLGSWLEHLLHDKAPHHARLIRPFAHWFVLRRARRTAARRTFTRESADFARTRVLAALDLLVSRIIQLTKNDVIEDSRATWLAIDGRRLMLPARLAQLVRQLRNQDEPRWTLGRLGTPVPWLFPGQSPTRPAVDILFGVRLQRCGIDAHAGRNTARLALAAELPASALADLTGTSVGTAERWSQWAKRAWAAYAGQRTADDRRGIGSQKLTNPTR